MVTDKHDMALNAGVEDEGVDVGALMKATAVMVFLVAAAVTTVFEWKNLEVQVAEVAATQESGYPALREYKAEVAGKLGHYAVIDAAKGTYRIPIERAMDLVIQDRAGDAPYSSELRLSPHP